MTQKVQTVQGEQVSLKLGINDEFFLNEKVYFCDANKLGKQQLVILMNRDIVINW